MLTADASRDADCEADPVAGHVSFQLSAHVVGTERGVTELAATFSACWRAVPAAAPVHASLWDDGRRSMDRGCGW
jgi:hypothetical protein